MDTVVADFNTATSEEGDVVDKLARGWSAMTKDSAFPGVISPMWCTVGFKVLMPSCVVVVPADLGSITAVDHCSVRVRSLIFFRPKTR